MAKLHPDPTINEHNLLDMFSSKDRLQYNYKSFIATERLLVKDHIVSIIPGGTILNIGCGRFGTERSLFPKSNYEIFGVDVNEESLRILREKELYDGLYKASIDSLPFASGSFDIIYLRLVLHHLVYPKNILGKGLQECFRVLKTGGVLAFVEPNSWHPVGAVMNVAHLLGFDMYIHGTDDDVALSPLMLRRQLSKYGSNISTHAVSYSWRRLPVPVQAFINHCHVGIWRISNKIPYFGHTLMMVSVKN